MRPLFAGSALVGFLAFAQAGDEAAAKPPLELVKTIPLPGVEGRIDHMALDAKRQRLHVAALANNTLEVVSLVKGERERTVKDLPEVQGVAFLDDLDRVAVACGGDGTVRLFDGGLLDERLNVDLGDDADNVRHDPITRNLFVGFGDGALAKLDAAKGRALAKADLGAHPESFQLEVMGRRAFVNVAQTAEVVVVDRFDMSVKARWPVGAAKSNFPMALDERAKRLYLGCRAPPMLVVMSTDDGKVVSSVECSEDPDDIFLDAARKRIYVACGAGRIDVFDATDAAKPVLAARVTTAPGARTALFDAASNRLFLAVPKRGDLSAEIRVYEPR